VTPPGGAEQPFIAHLLELRTRLIRAILAVLAIFLVLMPFANKIYTLLALPLLRHLPHGSSMIATEVASPFLIPFKLTLLVAIVLAAPIILYQIWAFVAPGLYVNERRIVLPLLVSSTLLFYLGMAFAYYAVFPVAFAFLTSSAPEGVTVMTDIGKYLDFVSVVFLAFGVAFEVPVATVLLVWIGVTTPETLASKRPYVILGAFVLGAFLTPPDVVSQTLLAVPMWLLFELGIISSRLLQRYVAAGESQEHVVATTPGAYRDYDLEEELSSAESDERRLSEPGGTDSAAEGKPGGKTEGGGDPSTGG
jgi:sec-independent protein translocase protein TatC